MHPIHPSRYLTIAPKLAALTLLAWAALSSPTRADLYQSWTQEYDPALARGQEGKAIALDKAGNVFVTGYAKDAANVDQYYTAKYDVLTGTRLWEVIYSPNGPATPNAIAVDSEGNVIVTGSVNIAGAIDAYTVKYSGVDGAFLWAVQYPGPGGGLDEGIKVAVDPADNVIMTAKSVGNGSGLDIYTVKYAKDTGGVSWSDRYNSSGNLDDAPTDLIIDGTNNTIVVGEGRTSLSVKTFFLRKLDSAGVIQWTRTLDSGGDGGAKAVAVDATGNVFATGLYTQSGSSVRGYYTVKYSAGGAPAWTTIKQPPASGTVGGPTSIAVGADGHPVVTGWLSDGSNDTGYTEKYNTSGGGVLGSLVDHGNGAADTRLRQLIVDGSSNTIVVGETDLPGQTGGSYAAIFLTKYNSNLTSRIYGFIGSTIDLGDNIGAALALDGNGGVALTGSVYRRVNNIGYPKLATLRFGRFVADKGDELPNDPEVPVDALFATGNAPAVSDIGSVAALIGATSGKAKLTAIFTQGTAGGSAIPAVQKGTAPGITGAKFASFSDPVVAPNGRYAFAAKVTGVPGSQANGVWTNLSGTLQLALQQGKPVPSVTENLSSVMSLSVRDAQLLALVKLAAPGKSNVALISLNTANAGTKLLRTGDPVTVNAQATTIKSLTVLSPALLSPGDGRWQGNANTVVLATLADKRSVIYRITTAGAATPMLFTEGDAAAASGVTGAKWKTFGKPAVTTSGGRFAMLATLTGAPATADTMLFYSANGTSFTAFAKENAAPNDPGLSALTYSGFSDPLVNSNGDLAFIATLKGTGVKPANSKALLFGAFGTTYEKVARLGDAATDGAGVTGTAVWNSFVSFALAGGVNGGPIFVAKLSGAGVTPKTSLGVWAVGSDGLVRRLIRTGDAFGDRTVASFNLLKAVPTAFAAARSFNASSAVAVQITFTDKSQALLKIGIP